MSSLPALNPEQFIEALRPELSPIVADNGQSFDRLRTVFMIAVQQNPDILKCSPESLRREISKCAADGLVPDSKEAVLLPYYDKEAKVHICNYQPMVHGVIKRLRELGGVFQIVCNLVFANDIYEENEADPESLVHRSPGFNKPRGDIVGGYVIFRDDQKRIMHFEKMSKADFDRVRAASKSSNSPAWTKWFEEMCRKAVLRRGSKYLSTNNDKIRALIERQDSMFEFSNGPAAIERVNPFGGPTIDHGNTAALEHKPDQTVEMDAGKVDTREKEPVRQQGTQNQRRQSTQGKPADDFKGTRSDQREQKKPDEAKKEQTKPTEPQLPDLPDLSVQRGDVEKAQECAEKILGIPLDTTIDLPDRRGNLKNAAGLWKATMPEYLHPLVKACIDMADWSIKRALENQVFAAEHAMFAHKVKGLLGVEKLNLKYPD